MTPPRAAAPGAVLNLRILVQFTRYGLSSVATIATQLALLVILIELAGSSPIVAPVLGFAGATFVSYMLQHRFVFARSHGWHFPRYLAATPATLALNTLLFWTLARGAGIAHLASQALTIGVSVPLDFTLNRSFTFAA